MSSARSLPMLPWVILDPSSEEWDEGADGYSVARSAAEILRRHCSLIIGRDDLTTIEERARDGRSSAYRLLRDTIRSCPVRVRGRSIIEIEELLDRAAEESAASIALVPDHRAHVIATLASHQVDVVSGPRAFMFSDCHQRVADSSRRMYDEGTDREVIWSEVLEPFTRARVLNLHEGWIFSLLTWPEANVETSGLYWFLSRLRERAEATRERMEVVVRGGHDWIDRDGYHAARVRLQQRCDELEEAMRPWVDLHLEVLPSPRTIHARFMLARSEHGANRLLSYEYPYVTDAGLLEGAVGRSPVPRQRNAEFTLDTRSDIVGIREREWNRCNADVARNGRRRR